MTINLGVKALLGWVNSIKLSAREITVDDLQDGTVLLKLVYMLKKEPNPPFSHSTEDRFKLIADFVERDCRFSAAKGTSLSWDSIRDGINLTVEIAKVLLLLVYHDMMNDRCSLNMLECDVEREIANLTGSFVMESEGCVYLNNGLDAYLARRYLPVSREIFERSATTSTSNVSTISSLSDDESPVFHRARKIPFVDMQTVASSSVSKSPLQDIMNTPKFQMRKMQRQMIKERDYRDGLERELVSNLALIAQRESQINQLQYRLEKLKAEQGDQEQVTKEQIDHLESKNNTLQMSFNEMLKQNKDLKTTSSLMERKVDELTEENGVLSSQVRAVCSQLATFEVEINRLTETQASAEEELRIKTSHLQSELNQATAQKELLTEQIQILQGKISCLEDEISRATKEEVGENMWPIMEREMLETEISGLKSELESTICSLKKAEVEIQIKTHQLAEYQQEITQQKELLKQQKSENEEIIQAKDEILDKLKKELTEQRAVLQHEIQDLKLQLEQVEQQKTEQMTRLQQHSAACEREIEKLKEIKETAHQKELLQQQLSASEDRVRSMREEIQAKEEQMNMLRNQSSEQSELLHQEIRDLKKQLETLGSSLRSAEENLQSKENLFAKQQLQTTQHMEAFQAQMVASQDEVKRLNAEILAKEEQLVQLKTETSSHSELLQQEIEGLNKQIKSMSNSLEIAKDQVQAKEDLIAKQEQESTLQIEALREHSAGLEEEVNQLREKIQTKESEVDFLKVESCKESEVLQNEIQSLKDQVESLSDLLKTATEQVQAKENLLAQKELVISQEKDSFQNLMTTSEEEMRVLREQIQAKEEQLVTLKKEGSIHSDMLQQEIVCLKKQLDNTVDSLSKAEEKVQTQLDMLNKQERESGQQKELLQQQLSASEDRVRSMTEEIQAKEEQMMLLRRDSSEQLDLLNLEIQTLKEQVETLGFSLRTAEENKQTKEDLLVQQQQENTKQREVLQSLKEKVQQVEILQDQIYSREEEIQKLKESQSEKESLLLHTEEQLQILQTELSVVTTLVADKDQNLNTLRGDLAAQADLVQKAKEEAEANERILTELKAESSKQTDVLQHEIQDLKGELKNISLKLLAKEEMLLKTQQETTQQIDLLQQQLVSVNAELNQHKETQAAALRMKEDVREMQVATLREKEAFVQEKEGLMARIHQAEKDQKALERQLQATVFEKNRLAQAKQAIERENAASGKLESALQQELEILKMEREKFMKENEKAEETEMLKRDLQEQLSAKSEATEHYKEQMKKAVSHYNDKKQLLQESQQEVAELKHSLEVKDCEVKTLIKENKILQWDLEKAQTSEKKLLNTVASLKAQLACADGNLRVQNKIHGKERSVTELCYLEVPNTCSSIETRVKRSMSSDSLDHSSLEDSLNNTRKFSAPEESSTPLVRSSERLAAKRRGLQAESLDTLYLTPINTRQINRTSTENKMELDSARKNTSSSVKRRRTTQKTPGCSEGDETFYSLASARSQPNLASAHAARPVSMELFDTPARMTGTARDQLNSLPGYRRSTVHSQTTSTFCVGAENEPDGAPEDWMRIAEIQARNKACPPHLKSSYPVESETGHGGAFIFTDEDLRTGDPSDTIRRASMMPGQLQDSLASHQCTVMTGQSGAAAGIRSHRLSLMPGQLRSKTVSSSQLKSPKGTKRSSSTLSLHQTSPEKRVKASCFPRPLTPKNKTVNSGSCSSQLHSVLSPAERRQSMAFTFENTPKNSNYLKKGLNKLRSSTRKSPGKSAKKPPAQIAARKCQENMPTGNSRAGVGRAGRAGMAKSPQVTATSRSAKSPGLTASARKKPVSLKEESLAGSRKR